MPGKDEPENKIQENSEFWSRIVEGPLLLLVRYSIEFVLHATLQSAPTRRHTNVKVPVLLIGSSEARTAFASNLTDLIGIHRGILRTLSPQCTIALILILMHN